MANLSAHKLYVQELALPLPEIKGTDLIRHNYGLRGLVTTCLHHKKAYRMDFTIHILDEPSLMQTQYFIIV